MADYTKTSPSQFSNFSLCNRRWFYGSILRLPQPQNKYAAAGEAMHKQQENYLENGVMPTHPSCIEGLKYVAPPKTPDVFIEAKTTNPPLFLAGLLINGRIDYLDGRDPLNPIIKDWKSKSNPKGIQSSKKLATDPQLSIYGAWALVKYPDAQNVEVSHIYLGRDEAAPFAKEVPVVLTADAIRETTDAMVPGFEAMKVAAALTAEEVSIPAPDKNGRIQACWAFGEVCPYYDRCKPYGDSLSFSDLFPSEDTDVTLLETLKESPGQASIRDPSEFVGVSTATPTPVVATDSTESTGGALLRKLRGG